MPQRRVATSRRFVPAFALLMALIGPSRVAHAQAVRPDAMSPNGVVRASVLSGNTLYVGGDFDWIGHPTGPGAVVDAVSGVTRTSFPRFLRLERVNVAIPDGNGGWYVGGEFTLVGSVARQNLAHVLSNGQVESWAPEPDAQVTSLILRGGTLIVGGDFTNIGGQPRNYLAAVSTTTGLATAWNPDLDGSVLALAASATHVFAGGFFSTVGGASHLSLAAIDASTGVATAGWGPQIIGQVSTLALSDTTLYVGGNFFTFASGPLVSNLVAIGAVSGVLHAWSPAPDGAVNSLSVPTSGSPVYVAGDFHNVGGLARRGLAALSSVTGDAAVNWNPVPDSTVSCVAWAGNTIYASGPFEHVGASVRLRMAAIDSLTGKATAWAPQADGDVDFITRAGSSVFVGGSFGLNSVGGAPRLRAGAIDVVSGRVLPWNPSVDGTVEAMAVQGGTVYLGGSFANVGGVSRPFAAAVDRRLGLLRSGWTPAPDGEVLTIAAGSGATYFGGSFTNIGGQARTCVAALDTTDGTATAWNPNPQSVGSPIVMSLATNGSVVFVGGAFTTIGGTGRQSLAAIGPDGLATSWSADVGGLVACLSLAGNNLYLGGSFAAVSGQPRTNLAMVNASTAAVSAWNPVANNFVFSVAAAGDTIYAGGFFTSAGGGPRHGIVALNAAGNALTWQVDIDVAVYSIVATPFNVYLGGDFTIANGLRQPNLAFAGAGSLVTGVDDGVPSPRLPLVAAALPNPFTRATQLRFSLPQAARVTLDVLDVTGRRVARLLDNAWLAPGAHQLPLEAAGLRPGVYLCRLQSSAGNATMKLVRQE